MRCTRLAGPRRFLFQAHPVTGLVLLGAALSRVGGGPPPNAGGSATDASTAVTVTVNGQEVGVDESGTFSLEITLVEGQNAITTGRRSLSR